MDANPTDAEIKEIWAAMFNENPEHDPGPHPEIKFARAILEEFGTEAKLRELRELAVVLEETGKKPPTRLLMLDYAGVAQAIRKILQTDSPETSGITKG